MTAFNLMISLISSHPLITVILVSYCVLTVWFLTAKSKNTTPVDAWTYTVDASEMVFNR